MLISELKMLFLKRLKDEFPETEITSFFHILSELYLGLRRIDIALDPDFELSELQISKFENALLRLKEHEPIQYITGNADFYGLEFRVDKNVLIPRPETEELVTWIIQDFKGANEAVKILDIGTGSGCIPITLAKKLPQAKVNSWDISTEAICIAKQNADLHKVKVDFQQVDVLAVTTPADNYDVIVSNPPYVRELEKESMQKNVLDFEPDLALYVQDENPLIFYEKITLLAKTGLNTGGALYFEINQYLAKETMAMVKSHGFEAELKKDIFGNYRKVKAVRN